MPGKQPGVAAATPASVHHSVAGHRYALDGTFYMVRYAATRTPTGVYGFPPGCEVHLVKPAGENQPMLVTDGRQTIEISPLLLTRDLEVADAVRWADQAAQAAIADEHERRRQAYEVSQRPVYIAHAQDVEAAEYARLHGSAVGGVYVPLQLPAQPVGGWEGNDDLRSLPTGGAPTTDETAATLSALGRSPFTRLPSASDH